MDQEQSALNASEAAGDTVQRNRYVQERNNMLATLDTTTQALLKVGGNVQEYVDGEVWMASRV
jgi:flagellar biosynthesis/type III secretory pathway chaperone